MASLQFIIKIDAELIPVLKGEKGSAVHSKLAELQLNAHRAEHKLSAIS